MKLTQALKSLLFEEEATKTRKPVGPTASFNNNPPFLVNSSSLPTLMNRGSLLPNNVLDKPWTNSAFYDCLVWLTNTFPEAPLVVDKWDEGKEKWVIQRGHPIELLVGNPNPYFTSNSLWAGTLISRASSGNGFWYKARNTKNGYPQELWYIPHWQMSIRWSDLPGAAFIAQYQSNTAGRTDVWDPNDIVHFKYMVDPENPRIGLGPVAGMGLEMETDQQTGFSAKTLIKNLGLLVPVISPKNPDDEIDDEGAQTIIASYVDKTTGNNAGKPVVLSIASDINVLSIRPRDMDFRNNRAVPVDRICAALGVDPLVIGLSGEQATYKNKEEARRASYECGIIPTQKSIALELDSQLLWEWHSDPWNYRCRFDNSDVRILQSDATDLADRVGRLYISKVIDRYKAKEMIGEVAQDGDKGVYYTNNATSDSSAQTGSTQVAS